ncbi:MAG: transcription termination factor NusA [Patescibacteria group bacterium]|jgi:N utilization substance protein A
MATNPIVSAIAQIAEEKGLSKEIILETVEAALAAAYRKDFGRPDQIIRVHLDPETDQMKVERVYNIVADDEIKELEAEMTVEQAKLFTKKPVVGEEVIIPLPTESDFGRIAAQTAKQVIIQRIREAERELLYQEFKEKEHMLLNGSVQQIEGENVVINLGKINGIMFPVEQIRGERYQVGNRLKVFVKEVVETMRGPQVSVSRADAAIVAKLFELEVPEIAAGTVEIRSISREAGTRSKVAVTALQEGLDPVGSCVGQHGIRVKAILEELGEEKIDIILWDENPIQFITNALSPAKVIKVTLNENERSAIVTVPEDQLSLAIGRNGQNVRLASKLTGWNLDINKEGDEPVVEAVAEEAPKKSAKKTTKAEKPAKEAKVKKPASKTKPKSK